LRRRAPL
jgi:hypothetical protein